LLNVLFHACNLSLGEITVMDLEELMAPQDFFNDSAGDFLGLMGPLSFTHSGDSAARQEARRTTAEVGQASSACLMFCSVASSLLVHA
jgi:hypothetical protein